MDYVRAVGQALGVEIVEEEEDPSTEALRREANALLDGADPKALAEALALLRKPKR